MSTNTIHQSEAPGITAVLYQRVAWAPDSENSRESAIRGQLDATRRKAAELAASVVEEFTDSGVSGRTINRPALQRMLAHIDEHDTTHCIVADLARLARDQTAYTVIRDALTVAEVTLVSCEERTCDPSVDSFVHKILSTSASLSPEELFTDASAGRSARRQLVGRARRIR